VSVVERRYWDSDCFLGWLNQEPDKEDLCGHVLTEADEGKILLVTSALTLAEVLKIDSSRRIDIDQEQQVINFFKNEYIAVRNVTRHIAESARELVWHKGIDPKDAIHVATAIDAGLEYFNTFDKNLLRKNGLIGDPPLIISRPQVDNPKLRFD